MTHIYSTILRAVRGQQVTGIDRCVPI